MYIYPSESSHHILSENDVIYRCLSYCSWEISYENTKKDAGSAEILQISSISNPNISETVSHSIINNTISWKCITRTFRCIHVNC